MDINYELYKVFYYVATTLSFSEASRHLFISQSAVSQSIKALEKKLGPRCSHSGGCRRLGSRVPRSHSHPAARHFRNEHCGLH